MKTLSIFGDSIVYGVGDPIKEARGWTGRLQQKLIDKFIIWNFGIPGDTSEDLLARIDDELTEKNPDIVMVAIGVNDSQYIGDNKDNTLVSLKDFLKNLEKIVGSIKKFTSEIIFIGFPRMNDSITTTWNFRGYFCNANLDRYDKVLEEFCEENNLKYIPLSDLLNTEDLSDGAHPNSEGYQKIADRIEKLL